jgi:hypothetical protein
MSIPLTTALRRCGCSRTSVTKVTASAECASAERAKQSHRGRPQERIVRARRAIQCRCRTVPLRPPKRNYPSAVSEQREHLSISRPALDKRECRVRRTYRPDSTSPPHRDVAAGMRLGIQGRRLHRAAADAALSNRPEAPESAPSSRRTNTTQQESATENRAGERTDIQPAASTVWMQRVRLGRRRFPSTAHWETAQRRAMPRQRASIVRSDTRAPLDSEKRSSTCRARRAGQTMTCDARARPRVMKKRSRRSSSSQIVMSLFDVKEERVGVRKRRHDPPRDGRPDTPTVFGSRPKSRSSAAPVDEATHPSEGGRHQGRRPIVVRSDREAAVCRRSASVRAPMSA